MQTPKPNTKHVSKPQFHRLWFILVVAAAVAIAAIVIVVVDTFYIHMYDFFLLALLFKNSKVRNEEVRFPQK